VSITITSTPSLITRRRENVGSTRTVGLEVDAELKLHRDLRLSAGYLLADSRIFSFPANLVLEGNYLPQIPKQQLNFQLYYHPQTRFAAGIQARISGGQFEDDLNTRRLGSYFTMDATMSYRIHRGFELFAAAENIFNSRYDIGLTPVRTVAAPAFARIGLRWELPKR
jgi:outer membrane receptor protein involved in Fe transport